jgi:MFS family permease
MMYGYHRGSPRFVIGTVSVAHFLSHFYFLVFPPLFPLLREEFGVNNTQLGLLFSLLFLMPSILQIPVGDLVDRIGAKRVFVAGIAVTGLGTMATTLSTSYAMLLAFALLAGVGQSVFHPADFALLETVTDETNRGKGFGTHTFAGFLGFAAGPLIAGGLGVRYGWRTALFGLGTVGVAYAVAVWLTMEPVHLGKQSEAGTPGPDAGDRDEAFWRRSPSSCC